ncbi:MFS general substrate transporter [Microthyrium microscopicum]|uniref:MFS general substrate transporter n=1 Tax=Microthyrium microscopicum TaxID=703497 RepID=A0A6A6UFQ7_9PEZI|nr:MFS general substrate transporter [Microthyrium microscopicum]
MPAIFDHFVGHYKLSPHDAWRRAFFVPFAIIVGTAILMVVLCPDTPVGKWSERHEAVEANLRVIHEQGRHVPQSSVVYGESTGASPADSTEKVDKLAITKDVEFGKGEVTEIDAEYAHEVIEKPSAKEIFKVFISPQTVALMACYFNSFGSELAINSVLGAYYLKNFPKLGQTSSGRWAAMFGLLNVYGRPLGGIISDIIYKYTKGNLWAKKIWIHFLGVTMGVFMLAIGLANSHNQHTMIGLVAGLAFFMDASNGANFALVPHVHPQANGIVSGFVGAVGNFGGVIGAIIFRYNVTNYGKSIWILGVIAIVMNLSVAWIRPIPKGQIGGR